MAGAVAAGWGVPLLLRTRGRHTNRRPCSTIAGVALPDSSVLGPRRSLRESTEGWRRHPDRGTANGRSTVMNVGDPEGAEGSPCRSAPCGDRRYLDGRLRRLRAGLPGHWCGPFGRSRMVDLCWPGAVLGVPAGGPTAGRRAGLNARMAGCLDERASGFAGHRTTPTGPVMRFLNRSYG